MNPSPRRLLIVFPDEWLAYSPTVLNLADSLSSDFEVSIVAVHTDRFQADPDLASARVIAVRFSARAVAILKRLRMFRVAKAWRLMRTVSRCAARHGYEQVVGVDAVGAWAAGRVFPRVHLLSLEIERGFFFRALRQDRIASVTIQSVERLDFLYPEGTPAPVFLVQNAPDLSRSARPGPRTFRPRVVLLGNALPGHGVFRCIDALREPAAADYALTIKGIVPPAVRATIESGHRDLLESGRLVLDETYVPQQLLTEYLSRFSIGLCFYDLGLIAADDFNYVSCPSGKLFNYYAAGVPVVGSDILGLASVRAFDTGVLLGEPAPGDIAEGFATIRDEYARFVENCAVAADHFDFGRSVAPLKAHLVGTGSLGRVPPQRERS